jgi:hypothetical protein
MEIIWLEQKKCYTTLEPFPCGILIGSEKENCNESLKKIFILKKRYLFKLTYKT